MKKPTNAKANTAPTIVPILARVDSPPPEVAGTGDPVEDPEKMLDMETFSIK
jgi:hypothetical protein